MVIIDSRKPIRGRGAVSNPTGRYEKRQLTPFDDGWGDDIDDVEGAGEVSKVDEPMRLPTTVIPEKTKRAITRNNSPDLSFDRSLNPYKGCEHGCVYCADGDIAVLLADGSTRRLAEIKAGDEIYGTSRTGLYRRYTKARVLDHWETYKPAYRVTLEDGTSMITSADHRFLTTRGWKFVMNDANARPRRHLSPKDRLLGVGSFVASAAIDDDYRRGYLRGMLREYGQATSSTVGLASSDSDAVARASGYLRAFGIPSIRELGSAARETLRSLLSIPSNPSQSFDLGFLAAVFDADGAFGANSLVFAGAHGPQVLMTNRALSRLGFASAIDSANVDGRRRESVRMLGGLREHFRFFQRVGAAIPGKRDFTGATLQSTAPVRVVEIEPLRDMQLFDITTTTGDFVADGVVHHNCFARPTHAYLGYSPGIDFETKIFSKPDAPERLREELSKKSYHCAPITLGANTDPYQPVERELQISRKLLQVLKEFKHPVSIITKSALVQRDSDILADMAKENLAQVFVSTTTLDKGLARIMEPRAATPDKRIETIATLNKLGIPTHVMTAPMIPFVNDHEMEKILEAAYAAGARRAGYVLVRLPLELKDLFEEWLERHFPDRKEKVLNTIRQTRGGQLYESTWGVRMTGTGPYAQTIAARFNNACRRYGFNLDKRELDTSKFRSPETVGSQLALFG